MKAPRAAIVLAVLLLPGLLTACSAGESAEPEPSATPSPPSFENPLTLKVLSFNVFYGAGLERRFDEHVDLRFKGIDRTPELMTFLKGANPDVLAIEEAAGWDEGDPSFAQRLATELGMKYVLAPDAWELHVVLFSKYPIVAADYVSRLQDFNGVALRATLAVSPEQQVNVVAAHLNSMSRRTRACQVDALLDMTKDLKGRTILLGDMNFRANSELGAMLRDNGWQLVAAQERWPIDQIWLDERGEFTTGDWWASVEQPPRISDHFPVGAEVTFEAPTSPVEARSEAIEEPGVLDYACALEE